MKIYKTIKRNSIEIKCNELYEGESIEEKVRRVIMSKEPIEAISPMIYTERKDGVMPEYDIRTDRWEIAQSAMTTIATGKRDVRKNREMTKSPEKVDKPDTNSKVDDIGVRNQYIFNQDIVRFFGKSAKN